MLQIIDSGCQRLFIGGLGRFSLVVGSKILESIFTVRTLSKPTSQHINPAITDHIRIDPMFEENRMHRLPVHELPIGFLLEIFRIRDVLSSDGFDSRVLS